MHRVIECRGQRQTSTISIPCDNFGEKKAKFNLGMSRTTQMQLYKCIHIPDIFGTVLKDRLKPPDRPIAQQGIHRSGYSKVS
jgi:hypothetical protein